MTKRLEICIDINIEILGGGGGGGGGGGVGGGGGLEFILKKKISGVNIY